MEKKLEEIYKEFGERLKDVANEAIGEVITKYIPYAENDYDMNVYMRSRDLIQCFLTDKQPNEWMSKSDIFKEFNSSEVRLKMFNEYKDEIIHKLNSDIMEENERLKDEVQYLKDIIEAYKRNGGFYI